MQTVFDRNDEEWYNLRRYVQKSMMHPRAASVYLPAQNTVADDFLKLIDRLRDNNNEVEDFNTVLQRYTMECKSMCHFINFSY